jgi:hypothetical protein
VTITLKEACSSGNRIREKSSKVLHVIFAVDVIDNCRQSVDPQLAFASITNTIVAWFAISASIAYARIIAITASITNSRTICFL